VFTGVNVCVGVPVSVDGGPAVNVSVGVDVEVSVAVGVAVAVGVKVGVGVAVCVRHEPPASHPASNTVLHNPHEPAGSAQKTPQSQQSFGPGGGVGVGVHAGLTSTAQLAATPVHVSAMSQPPAAGRQTVLLGE